MIAMAALHSEALAARGSGRFERAAAAWRQLLERAPDDWALALELKRDLRAAGLYPDSDPQFRRAARQLPDEAWLKHYSALYQFHGSDLPAVEARARALLERRAGDVRVHAVLGEAARQRRNWAAAEAAFADAEALAPGAYGTRAAQARMYARLRRAGWDGGGARYAVLAVNLARNPERMAEIGRQFAGFGVQVRRIAGVEGRSLASEAVERLTGDAGAGRGTLGCFLGHRAAWEALLASGDDCALVVEDDVIPLLDLPRGLPEFGLPSGWDMAFVNDRLEPWRAPDRVERFEPYPVAAVMRGFDPEENAPGGDGYLLSREGARKLLDWTAADGMAGDVDWRMLAYGITAAETEEIAAPSHARAELGRWQARIGRRERLRASVLSPALIRTVGVSSDREDQNREAGLCLDQRPDANQNQA